MHKPKRLIQLLKTPWGRLLVTKDQGVGELAAHQYFMTNLSASHYRDGKLKKAYDLGSGLVTAAGVQLLVADWTSSNAAIKLFKNHGSGTGTNAATATDTALQTAIGTTATAGTQANGTSGNNGTYTTVGTVSYSGSSAVTEWGLFSNATLSGATMWDRKVFSAINVVSGDSIAFTYVLTASSGG